jgi:hypothetical protein
MNLSQTTSPPASAVSKEEDVSDAVKMDEAATFPTALTVDTGVAPVGDTGAGQVGDKMEVEEVPVVAENHTSQPSRPSYGTYASTDNASNDTLSRNAST